MTRRQTTCTFWAVAMALSMSFAPAHTASAHSITQDSPIDTISVAGSMTVARVAPETTTATSNASTPYPASAAAVPGTIEVENFDAGDAEVAYHDGSAGNSGGAYRETGVDLEPTADTSGLTERNRGTFPGPTPGLRLRIRAHPGVLSCASSSRHDPDLSGPHGSGSRAPAPQKAQNGPSPFFEDCEYQVLPGVV